MCMWGERPQIDTLCQKLSCCGRLRGVSRRVWGHAIYTCFSRTLSQLLAAASARLAPWLVVLLLPSVNQGRFAAPQPDAGTTSQRIPASPVTSSAALVHKVDWAACKAAGCLDAPV